MGLIEHRILFDIISPVYNLFFRRQTANYSKTLKSNSRFLDIRENAAVLDVGCGTGAFAWALNDAGYIVTGIDISGGMMRYGRKRNLDCRHGDIIAGLDFPDKSFDLVSFAYVAHGVGKGERRRMFEEAARLSRGRVLFHDYSDRRNIIINIIEYLEGSDYFNFIHTAESELKEVFSSVTTVPVKKYNNWYICKP